MIDRDKVFDAFRNCITEPKCRDCPWEQCEQFDQKKVEIPVTLALDVIELMKEHLQIARCKDCKYYDVRSCANGFGWCNRNGTGHGSTDDWFCADGERRDDDA